MYFPGNIALRAGEELVYADRHNHILAVQATDCMGRQSKPVMVNFIITPQCQIGWKGQCHAIIRCDVIMGGVRRHK